MLKHKNIIESLNIIWIYSVAFDLSDDFLQYLEFSVWVHP